MKSFYKLMTCIFVGLIFFLFVVFVSARTRHRAELEELRREKELAEMVQKKKEKKSGVLSVEVDFFIVDDQELIFKIYEEDKNNE